MTRAPTIAGFAALGVAVAVAAAAQAQDSVGVNAAIRNSIRTQPTGESALRPAARRDLDFVAMPLATQRRRMITEWPGMVRTWWQQLRRKRSAGDAPTTPQGRATSIGAALEFCRKVLPRRTVLFLISDFVDEHYLDVLRHAGRKHDLVAALVTDPRETSMPAAGLVTLVDAETGATRLVDTHSAQFRDELQRLAAQRQLELKDSLRASRVDLITFDANESMVDPLLRFFRERKRGRR